MKTESMKYFGLFFVVLFAFGFVSAGFGTSSHNASVVLTPSTSGCNVPTEFSIDVTNTAGPGAIYDVKIAKTQVNIATLTCGLAPANWTKIVDDAWFCHYRADDPTGVEAIDLGETLTFTFDATLDDQTECVSTFVISTLDNEGLLGGNDGEERNYPLNLVVDCTDPVIVKTVGNPKVAGDVANFLWWINQDTPFYVNVSDNSNQDGCDLGLDYCLIQYTLDGLTTHTIVDETGLAGASTWSYDFTYNEDSEHFLNITCYDLAGNVAEHLQTEKVDSTAPETTKTYGSPRYSPNGEMNNGASYPHYVDTSTPVTLNAVDVEAEETPEWQDCSIDNVVTYHHEEVVDDSWCMSEEACVPVCNPSFDFDVEDRGDGCQWNVYNGTPFTFGEESCHLVEFYSVDGIDNVEDMNYQCVFVEDKAPVVNKSNGEAIEDNAEEFITEANPNGTFHWIKSEMPITFTCEDQAPHPSREEELCFRVSYDVPSIWSDVTSSYCEGTLEGEYCCVDASVASPFVFAFNQNEESMHKLDYFCRDALGHESDEHTQYYKVDDTEPSIDLVLHGPYFGDCNLSNSEHGECFVDNATRISLETVDGGEVCAVDNVECEWRYKVNDGEFSGWFDYNESLINFPEESFHTLNIRCEDGLGNVGYTTDYFSADHTAPETTFSVTGPQIPGEISETSEYPRWIDTVSRIKLEAVDSVGPHDSGVSGIYYRVTKIDDNEYCRSAELCDELTSEGDFRSYGNPFGLNESCHLIEYYAVDNVGKIEEVEKQCVFSDHTAPIVGIADVDGPQKVCGEGEDCDYWVTNQTEIYLECYNNESEPHPAPLDKFYWRVNVDGENGTWIETPVGEEGHVSFSEDSMHELEYYCVDGVGKTSGVLSTMFRVDSTAPEITITESQPKYYNETEDKLYLNHVTEVGISANDPDPTGFGCNIEGVVCEWGYYLDDEESFHELNSSQNPFVFPEDTKHELVVECEDALGNKASATKTYYVDWTAPGIDKYYGEPFRAYRFEDYWAKWINSKTPIFGSVYDNGPHKSGIAEVKYRTFVVDNESCKYYYRKDDVYKTKVRVTRKGMYDYDCDEVDENDAAWTTVNPANYSDFEFSIPEDSCHMIEIMATDNVNKCALHKQFVYVDNQAPTPNKTVGEPSTEWYPVDVADDPLNPQATHFYPWIVDRCWNGENDSIDCWKVTLDTPISMDCSDPLPHPVGDEKVCFNVELDAEDATRDYCRFYGGEYVFDEEFDDSFCCVEQTVADFKFTEESEHNLKYYCEDALGNKGALDDEKFKVAGHLFKIQLNDKWNLISVPFVLQNDDPEEVFKDTESVKTVWGYEDGQWKVYRPGEPTNNLNSIEPGLGYWVLADCNETTNPEVVYRVEDFENGCGPNRDSCEMLVVGGSLYNAGPVSPPSHNLKAGWNLIGYYGTEGRMQYVGPNGFYWIPETKEAYCELYSLRNLDGGYPTKWSSLVGYWEPDNPNQWDWLGLHDEMDPGAGYWLFMNEDGKYAPETICGQTTILQDAEFAATNLLNQ